MNSPKFVISLDFELFWGVTDATNINSYSKNILGERKAIPRMLDKFKEFNISATWASVGMAMCKDYKEWSEFVPKKIPKYKRQILSNYSYGNLAKEHPRLFFGNDLLKIIMSYPNQEIATHSFSHIYFNEEGIEREDLEIDLSFALEMANRNNINYSSIVFPRNQYNKSILGLLPSFGIKKYRGNLDYFLYREGHYAKGGNVSRAIRYLDTFLPIHSNKSYLISTKKGLTNIPGGFFLRPFQGNPKYLNALKLNRLTNLMTKAAKRNEVFHLWWHPHNFGVSIDENINNLEVILKHFRVLENEYGMKSCSMDSVSNTQ